MKCDPVIWRRFGKEHSEDDGFRINPQDVVARSLRLKVEKAGNLEPDVWPWTHVSDDLIVERPTDRQGQDRTTLYYLLKRHWLIIENSPMAPGWPWYVHIGTTQFDQDLDCWVFTDHFVDVLVGEDLTTHTVMDLDDLAEARRIGLVDDDMLNDILIRTQELVDSVREGSFPPEEVRDASRESESSAIDGLEA